MRHKTLSVAATLVQFGAVAAGAATFVSFQEGDLRQGANAGAGTNGAVINATYGMGATRIRSDQGATVGDGQQLLVGNNSGPTFRALLAFDVSYLTNLAGGDLSRIDSAALVLTHDNAGAGGNSLQSVHLTLPFNEATAAWNDPHGTGTNAGGFIGAELRQDYVTGTATSPTKEVWGSPAWAWTNGFTDPDLMAQAVRDALTNASKTLWLLVKRRSESTNTTGQAYFSRYQHDGSASVDSRPELIVGVDSFQTNSPPGTLAAYYFNENNNTAPSLAAVAAAVVSDTNRVVAGNATAGSGLGPFGPGGTGENTHGYGTAHYVSPPSGFYARANATASSEAGAVANNDCLSFTLAPQPGYALHFQGVSAWAKLQAGAGFSATVVVRSSLDGFSNNLARLTVAGNSNATAFAFLTNSFGGAEFTSVYNPVEFRFYFFDDTDSSGDIFRLDDIVFYGGATNPPPGVQLVSLAATDASATESGGDTGAFTLRRLGDASGPLTVNYTMSGTASNGVDYEPLSGAAEFAPGVSNFVVQVSPLDDLIAELEETVVLTLNTNAAYVIVGPASATVRLADDNDPPEFVVAATAPIAYEPAATVGAVFTITRVLGDTNTAVAVQFILSGTASNGADYTASVTNAIAFAAGELSRAVVITPVDDLEFEGAETVVLTLLPGAGYSVGGTNSATATIYDDEGVVRATLLLEAESFSQLGGWVVDQQFVDIMGSCYLLAHGKGRPVADAHTTAQFPAAGAYRLWVRTKDWTAPLPDHPGSFQVVVGGVAAPATFGTVGQGWLWQDGGMVMVADALTEIRLHDLTGFEGRCDALFFTTDPTVAPPNALPDLSAWRRAQLGWPDVPGDAGAFDLVVIGGGISGCSAALAAARQGLRVALIHDRPFPGGNASRDVRVHTLGNDVGGITAEINTPDYLIGSDQFIQSDQQRMQVLQRETNLHLFTEWRAFAVQTNGARLTSVDAKHIRTGEERRFRAPLFVDSTGDGWIGHWAGALYRMGREARAEFNESLAPLSPDAMTMGSTISWNSRDAGQPVAFPAVPWATNVAKDYVATRGDWWWEYGLLLDTIYDAEEIRDHLLQAIYGSFANAKKSPANANRELDWVGYVAGKRESRRLIGDYILTEADVRNNPLWRDAVVTEFREIDIHYPKAGSYDWQTYAQFTSIDAYWIPFRCLYSTNIDNLMMAGRCLSASHVGLGSPRVMNTGGQMGVAVGTAAALCRKYGASPRVVGQRHAAELQRLMDITQYFTPPFDLPSNTVATVDTSDLAGVEITGAWISSRSEAGYFGPDYLHDGNTNKGGLSVTFRPELPMRGLYRVYLRWTASSTRATNVPVDIVCRDGTNTVRVNQTTNTATWVLLGAYSFDLGNGGRVAVRNAGTSGHVIADAVALAADFAPAPAFTGLPWQDDDGDGVCNYAEFLNGTNPRDPQSFVRVDLLTQSGACALRFVAMAGKSYTVQYCESLASGSWRELAIVEASGLTREVDVPDWQGLGNRMRFYRLVTP